VIQVWLSTDPEIALPENQAVNIQLNSTDDYVAAYSTIVSAVHDNIALTVLCKDRLAGSWFRVLAQKYGAAQFLIAEFTLRGQLEKQINIAVPAHITDRQIKESHLLDLTIPGTPDQSFEDYMLEVFFGPFLTRIGALRRVAEFIRNYDPEQWNLALRERPLIREIYQKRLSEFKELYLKENKPAEMKLLEWLSQSPVVLIRNLSALKILANYPPDIGKTYLWESLFQPCGSELGSQTCTRDCEWK